VENEYREEYEKEIKILRLDNDGEYINDLFL